MSIVHHDYQGVNSPLILPNIPNTEPVMVPRNLRSPVGPDPLYYGNEFGDPDANPPQDFQRKGSSSQGIQGNMDPRSNGDLVPIADPQMNSFLSNPRSQEDERIRTRQEMMQEPKNSQMKRLRQERIDTEVRHPGIYQLNQNRVAQIQQQRASYNRAGLNSYHEQGQNLQARLQEDQRTRYRSYQEDYLAKQARRNYQGL